MGGGGMSGVTYASGTIYNVGTMCPSNANQGYVCDGRNFGDKYLNPQSLRVFCSGHLGSSRQFGFGHGVTAQQKCGQCAQIRVPRRDGSYNYMTIMMVDHFTWSMEVGTTEIAYLVQGTNWVVGDRANFDYRIVGDYDCFSSFDGNPLPTPIPTTPPPSIPGNCNSGTRCGSGWGNANGKCGTCCGEYNGYDKACNGEFCFADLSVEPCAGNGNQPTPQPANSPTPRPVNSPTPKPVAAPTQRPGECGVSSNWRNIKINPYWGSTTSQFFAMISGTGGISITSFAIRGADQSNDDYQDCYVQNANMFQCVIRGGALTEPASVMLNGGEYYGVGIIESMSGSTAQYPITGSTCSGRFTFEDENESGVSWTIWFAICILLLLGIGIIIGICFYKKRMRNGKGYVSNKKEVDTVELRDNDGMNVTTKQEMIDVNNEIEVEIEAEMPMTAQ